MFKPLFISLFLVTYATCQSQQQHQAQTNGNPENHHHQIDLNKDYTLEHLDSYINKTKDQMTPDEQNFYYFKLHDYNNDNMLDGLELVGAFAHTDEQGRDMAAKQDPNAPPHVTPRMSDDELIKIIDEILLDEDKNGDGYITYQEFLEALKRG